MRTTVDIDEPILKDLKKIGQKEGKSLGRLISDILAESLGQWKSRKGLESPPQWAAQAMGARVDLADREALYQAMEPERQTREDPSS